MRLPARVLLFFSLGVLTACGAGSTGTQIAGPGILLTEPSTDVRLPALPIGEVSITYTDFVPDGGWVTDLIADKDGVLGTTDDQIVLFEGRPSNSGQPQQVIWPMQLVWSGTYAIYGRVRKGGQEFIGVAPGRVTLDLPPQIKFRSPIQPTTVCRAGFLCVGYELSDQERRVTLDLRLDEDGDFDTTNDSYALAAPPRLQSPTDPCTPITIGQTPVGTYRLMGAANDEVNPRVVRTAPSTIDVANVSWTKTMGSSQFDWPGGLYVKPDGSSLLSISYSTAITLGAGEVNQTTLSVQGGGDAVLASFGRLGTLQWARAISGPGLEQLGSVFVRPDGSILISGSFDQTLTLGPGESTETTLTSAGGTDSFIACLESTGTLRWAMRRGDAELNLIGVGGVFSDGSFVVGGQNATAQGIPSQFELQRLDANGVVQWTRTAVGTATRSGILATETLSDGSFVTHGFATNGTLVLGSGEPNETTITATGGDSDFQYFLARWGVDGSLLWAQALDSTNVSYILGIKSYPNDSFLVTGSFENTLTLGTGELNETTLVSAGNADGYVARYQADGRLQWARRIGGPVGADGPYQATILPDDSAVVTGAYVGTVTFEGHTANVQLQGDNVVQFAFTARYNKNGEVLWARGDGSAPAGYAAGRLIGSAADGSCVVMGTYTNTVTFGAGEENQTTITASSQGWGEVYLTRINADGGY